MSELDALNKRYEALEEENRKQHQIWTDIAKHFNPSLSLMFDKDNTEEEEYAKDIYIQTGIESANTMADGIVGNMISKSTPWVGMYALDPDVNKKKSIQEFFQKVNFGILSALSRSNFYNIIPSYTKMGITIATATMFVEEDINSTNVVFSMKHPKEIFIDHDWYGNVDTIYRRIRVGAAAAANYFIKEKGRLSKELLKKAEENPYELVDIRHAMFPAKDEWFKFPGVNGSTASVYWQPNEKDVIRVGGFDHFPGVSWRYRLEGLEKYGRGPSHDALPSMRGGNVVRKTLLQTGQMAGDPPLNIPEEFKNKVRNKPRGANYYRDPGRVTSQWKVNTHFPITLEMQEMIKKEIQAPFYIDYWKLLSQLTQRMTAMEVSERRGEKATLISTPIAKYESEALDNMLYKVYLIEEKNGRMPEVPNELTGDVGWEYNGLLAQMQKRSLLNDGIRSTLNDLERIMPMAPAVGRVFNWPNAMRDMALNNGFPAVNLFSEQEVEQQMAAEAEAAAKQKGVDQIEQLGKAAPGLNQPLNPDGMMAKV